MFSNAEHKVSKDGADMDCLRDVTKLVEEAPDASVLEELAVASTDKMGSDLNFVDRTTGLILANFFCYD